MRESALMVDIALVAVAKSRVSGYDAVFDVPDFVFMSRLNLPAANVWKGTHP